MGLKKHNPGCNCCGGCTACTLPIRGFRYEITFDGCDPCTYDDILFSRTYVTDSSWADGELTIEYDGEWIPAIGSEIVIDGITYTVQSRTDDPFTLTLLAEDDPGDLTGLEISPTSEYENRTLQQLNCSHSKMLGVAFKLGTAITQQVTAELADVSVMPAGCEFYDGGAEECPTTWDVPDDEEIEITTEVLIAQRFTPATATILQISIEPEKLRVYQHICRAAIRTMEVVRNVTTVRKYYTFTGCDFFEGDVPPYYIKVREDYEIIEQQSNAMPEAQHSDLYLWDVGMAYDDSSTCIADDLIFTGVDDYGGFDTSGSLQTAGLVGLCYNTDLWATPVLGKNTISHIGWTSDTSWQLLDWPCDPLPYYEPGEFPPGVIVNGDPVAGKVVSVDWCSVEYDPVEVELDAIDYEFSDQLGALIYSEYVFDGCSTICTTYVCDDQILATPEGIEEHGGVDACQTCCNGEPAEKLKLDDVELLQYIQDDTEPDVTTSYEWCPILSVSVSLLPLVE